jgi:DNA mismatch repair protein MutL
MGKIQLLEQNLINQIAAGEVIERPVSIVKELVENSLDAGTTAITIEIKDGGKRSIKIVDNGEGMTKDDLPKALLRHATSKIRTPEDLFRISTMGFRGEALASIASVSRLAITSKARESTEVSGYRLILKDSEVQGIESVAAVPGTTITVEDLFANIPARLKFLKTSGTEFSHIQQWVSRIMLARPDVSYTLIHDGEIVLQTQGDQAGAEHALRNAIGTVFGRNVVRGLREVKLEYEDCSISGYVSDPTVVAGSRQGQVFFVNNRHISSPLLNKAVDTAVSDLVFGGKYPYVILFIDIAYDQVDVNVHPAKKEVRFANSNRVFDVVASAVRNAYARPVETQYSQQMSQSQSASAQPTWSAPSLDFPVQPHFVHSPVVHAAPQMVSFSSQVNHDLRILGQAHRGFIIVLDGDDLLLIDQHAAHERILYEKFKKEKTIFSQPLMTPLTIELAGRRTILAEHQAIIREAGFVWEEYSGDTIAVREVPASARGSYEDLFIDLLDECAKTGAAHSGSQSEYVTATMACKAAIKDGDVLSVAEMRQLVIDLFATPNYQTCPHGRPTVIAVSREELFKSFKRT